MGNYNEGSSHATGENQSIKAILTAIRGVKQQIEKLALIIQQSLLWHSIPLPFTPVITRLKEGELARSPRLITLTNAIQYPPIRLDPPFILDPPLPPHSPQNYHRTQLPYKMLTPMKILKQLYLRTPIVD